MTLAVLQCFEVVSSRGPFMAFFHSFFDESGKFKDHKVVSFCGVCSPLSKLPRFDDEWNSLLQRNQLPWLTMKKALKSNVALSPTIRKQSIAERIETLKPFASCIADHLELGIAMTFDVEGYRALSQKAKKQLGGSDDPYYVAFMRSMLVLMEYTHNDDRISLICDDALEIHPGTRGVQPTVRVA